MANRQYQVINGFNIDNSPKSGVLSVWHRKGKAKAVSADIVLKGTHTRLITREIPLRTRKSVKKKDMVPAQEERPLTELELIQQEIAEMQHTYQSFKAGWDAPGMEAYDSL